MLCSYNLEIQECKVGVRQELVSNISVTFALGLAYLLLLGTTELSP